MLLLKIGDFKKLFRRSFRMIKIIKHGRKEFTHICSRCECEFTYEVEDIQSDAIEDSTDCISTKYIICPDCGNKWYINANDIGWPCPNLPYTPCNTPSNDYSNPCADRAWYKKLGQSDGNYVGDTPCTWCSKGPHKVTCSSSISGNIDKGKAV